MHTTKTKRNAGCCREGDGNYRGKEKKTVRQPKKWTGMLLFFYLEAFSLMFFFHSVVVFSTSPLLLLRSLFLVVSAKKVALRLDAAFSRLGLLFILSFYAVM